MELAAPIADYQGGIIKTCISGSEASGIPLIRKGEIRPTPHTEERDHYRKREGIPSRFSFMEYNGQNPSFP